MLPFTNSPQTAERNPLALLERTILKLGHTVKDIPQSQFIAANEDFWQSLQRENDQPFPDSQSFIEKRTEQVREETQKLRENTEHLREELTKIRKEMEQIRSCFALISDITTQVAVMEAAHEGWHKAHNTIGEVHRLKMDTYAHL